MLDKYCLQVLLRRVRSTALVVVVVIEDSPLKRVAARPRLAPGRRAPERGRRRSRRCPAPRPRSAADCCL